MARGRLTVQAVPVGADKAPEVAAFTRVACEFDPLTASLLRRDLFVEDTTVLGAYVSELDGVGAAAVRGGLGFVRLLAVHPRVRRLGVGTAVLGALEEVLREGGAAEAVVGPPGSLTPGVDVRYTEGVCFLEARGYERFGEGVRLAVPLRDLRDPPLPVRVPTAEDLKRIRGWVAEEHPQWLAPLERHAAEGTCVIHEDLGFACFDPATATVGPLATRRDARGRGVGTATLVGALRELRRRGAERAELDGAGPLPFFAKAAGARISRVFWWYRKPL